jgi:hypothetical protein
VSDNHCKSLRKSGESPLVHGGAGSQFDQAALIDDLLWNLRTWPLELVDWTTPRRRP